MSHSFLARRGLRCALAGLLFGVMAGPLAAQTPASDWIGPGQSGSWFDPARNGEGIVLELLADGSAVAFWFTYPASGEQATQMWLFGTGWVDGNRIRFESMLRPVGARFGEAFDPAAVQYTEWGSLELESGDCGRLTLRWQGPAEFGSGQRELQRLTVLDQLDCAGRSGLVGNRARGLHGLRPGSAAWFDPQRSGEGWIVEQLADDRTAMYWFTYDDAGRQVWLIGAGTRQGAALELADVYIAGGTRFGDAFDPGAVALRRWGKMRFEFRDCDRLRVEYDADEPGYGSGQHDAVRLTHLASLPCLDGAPPAPGNLAWQAEPSMPTPAQSEHAGAVAGDMIYSLGGFGQPRGFRRLDPASGEWTVLPDLPNGRHHLAAFALDGGVFMTGGAPMDSAPSSPGYRYDVANGQWEPRSELPWMFGSHAAVLNGRAWIGDQDGSLREYDPRQRKIRYHGPMQPAQPRDHSQVVAFLGEIWMLGGRAMETAHVAIFDPVSLQWRSGPTLREARAGFAAAASGGRLLVAGGEVLSGEQRTLASVELYTAGAPGWESGPPLPQALHGVPAAVVDGRFYVFGGSTRAGAIQNDARAWSLRLP
jgi:hypothetical protein